MGSASRIAVTSPSPVTRAPNSALGTCVDFPVSPWVQSFAPAAGDLSPLFAAFVATMTVSDSFISSISGFGASSFPLRPCTTAGRDEGLPGPDKTRTYVHGFFDTAGLVLSHHSESIHVAFDSEESLGDPNIASFGAQ